MTLNFVINKLIVLMSLFQFGSFLITDLDVQVEALEIQVAIEIAKEPSTSPIVEVMDDDDEKFPLKEPKLKVQNFSAPEESGPDTNIRIPFEQKYPQLARNYTYPRIDYAYLEQIILSALEGTKYSRQLDYRPILADKKEFVRVERHQLFLGDSPFYFIGFNSYNALMHSVKHEDRIKVDLLLERAKSQNLNVMRIMAFCDGQSTEPPGTWSGFYIPCEYTFQEYPGSLNEEVFVGLDYLLYKSRQVGIRLILTLTNYQAFFGGVEMYARWALSSNDLDRITVLDFYTNPSIKLLYQAYIAQIITRVNTYTDIPYYEDPTIMAWDLINDPKCPKCPGATSEQVLNAWLSEMSGFVKHLAPKQLVTVGAEGNFGEKSSKFIHNPAAYVPCQGESFEGIGSLPNIDFASMQSYPFFKQYDYPMFQDCDDACRRQYMHNNLKHHIQFAQNKLQKPVVVLEFGLAGERLERSLVYKTILDTQVDSAMSGDALAGVMFWTAGIEGDVNWDNKMVYIDNSNYFQQRPQIEVLEEDQEYKEWLDENRHKFFRIDIELQCQEQTEDQYFDSFTLGERNFTLMSLIGQQGRVANQLSN